MSRFCEPDVRDPIGGSSQLKYYPYLLALSNPKKNAGAGAFPWGAAARRGQIVHIAEQQVKTKPAENPVSSPGVARARGWAGHRLSEIREFR
jgi:hypothetical protein